MNVRQLAARTSAAQEPRPAAPSRFKVPPRGPNSDFAKHLEFVRRAAGQKDIVARISQHAWHRIDQRGISMTDAEQATLGEAMLTLEERGARDALLLRADAAFVVNVPNRTVVTALDHQEMHQRVFTQIDSAFLLER